VDAEVGDLERERLAERLQRPLRRVVHADSGKRGDAADRGDLDDVAGALLAHDRQRRLGHPDRAEDVGLDLVAGLLRGDLLDRAEEPVAGVVDDHVEAAELLPGRLHGGDVGVHVLHVERQGQHVVAVLLGQRLERRYVARRRRHPVTALERRFGPDPAEALRAPGDEPNF
jgi:hypothetical protein